MKKLSFLLVLLSLVGMLLGQNLLTEDFEGDTSSWTIVNGEITNQWHIGNSLANGGSNSIYISNDAGVTNAYTTDSASTVHFYRDITFPENCASITLSFDFQGMGEGSNWDYLRVYLFDTDQEIIAETSAPSSDQLAQFLDINPWAQQSIQINTENCGLTKRLVFTWRNDGSGGTQPPAAIDNISIDYLIATPEPSPAILVSPANEAIDMNLSQILEWEPSGGSVPTGYEIYFGETNPPAFIADLGDTTSWTPTIELNFSTTYYWKVVPYNEEGYASNCPVWSFTTMNDPTQPLPYTQNFDGEEATSLSAINWTGNMSIGANHGVDDSKAIYKNVYGTSTNTIANVTTNPIGPIIDNTELKFDYRVVDYTGYSAGDYVATELDGDIIEVLVSTDFGVNFTPIYEINSTNHISSTNFANITLDLSDYVGEKVQLQFITTKGAENSSDYYIDIDNIIVREVPSNPTFAITPASKDFGLQEILTNHTQEFIISNTGAGNYNITDLSITGSEYFTLNPEEYTLPINISVDEPFTLTVTYSPQTVGEFTAQLLITDNIDNSVHEIALSGSSFNPIISDFPYIETFDGEEYPSPNWTRMSGLITDESQPTVVTTGWLGTPFFGHIIDHEFGPATKLNIYGSSRNHWLVTPPINLDEADGNVTLSFDLALTKYYSSAPEAGPEGVQGECLDDRFAVVISTDNGQTWTNENILKLWDNADSENVFNNISIEGENISINLSEYSGIVKIAFYGESTVSVSGDDNDLHIDNISLTISGTTPQILPPNNLTYSIEENNVTLNWEAPNRNLTGYKVYRNDTNLETLDTNTLTYNDTDLEDGTYTYSVTALYGTEESEAVTVEVEVDTQGPDILLPPSNLEAQVNGNNVVLGWDEPGGDTWFTHAVIDNFSDAIGTDSAVEFAVAQRFSPEQLINFGIAGAQLTQVAFMPNHATAEFTIKIWTGGSANPYNPGTLVHEQAVTGITPEQLKIVELSSPIIIPIDEELWIGYNVDTPDGFPAGCDDGPVYEGYGNIMYFNNAWTTLTGVASSLAYNWIIKGYAETNDTALIFSSKDAVLNPAVTETVKPNPTNTDVIWSRANNNKFSINKMNRENIRAFIGYNVYRGETLLTTTPITALTYTDSDVPNGEHTYYVTAVYDDGESNSISVNVFVGDPIVDTFPWSEGFENTSFPPTMWALVDNDNDGYNWSHFDLEDGSHSGNYCVASASYINNIGALTPDNWLITPALQLPTPGAGQGMFLKYYVAAQDPSCPNEHYAVMISTTDTQVSSFTNVFNETLSSTDWVEKIVDLSDYHGETIYVAFRHYNVTDMFYMKLDDVWVGSGTSETDISITPAITKLNSNYPNPFNPETTISFSVSNDGPVNIDIYNIKGQKVKSLVNDNFKSGNYQIVWKGQDDNGRQVGSGMYFYKMKSGKYTATRKMILMK
jgi:hypothetical protein